MSDAGGGKINKALCPKCRKRSIKNGKCPECDE